MDYALGNWLVEKPYQIKEVTWATTKIAITWNEFMAKARIWLTITYSRVSTSTNKTYPHHGRSDSIMPLG